MERRRDAEGRYTEETAYNGRYMDQPYSERTTDTTYGRGRTNRTTDRELMGGLVGLLLSGLIGAAIGYYLASWYAGGTTTAGRNGTAMMTTSPRATAPTTTGTMETGATGAGATGAARPGATDTAATTPARTTGTTTP